MQNLIKKIKEREQASDNPAKVRFAGNTIPIKEFNDVLSRATKEESLALLADLLGLWREAYKSPSITSAVAAKIINMVGFYIRRQMTVHQTDKKSLMCDLVPSKELGGEVIPFFKVEGEPEQIREYLNRLFPFSVRAPA